MQRRYWQYCIRDRDYEKHVDFIHYNSVKHGDIKRAAEWLYSSIHVYRSKGRLNYDWGYNDEGIDGDMFGEKV